jgi:HEAT repeat protein
MAHPSTPANRSAFEMAARYKKVIKLLAKVPHTEPGVSAADVFATMPQIDRDTFAAAAGVKPPSQETWDLFIEQLRERENPTDRWEF